MTETTNQIYHVVPAKSVWYLTTALFVKAAHLWKHILCAALQVCSVLISARNTRDQHCVRYVSVWKWGCTFQIEILLRKMLINQWIEGYPIIRQTWISYIIYFTLGFAASKVKNHLDQLFLASSGLKRELNPTYQWEKTYRTPSGMYRPMITAHYRVTNYWDLCQALLNLPTLGHPKGTLWYSHLKTMVYSDQSKKKVQKAWDETWYLKPTRDVFLEEHDQLSL